MRRHPPGPIDRRRQANQAAREPPGDGASASVDTKTADPDQAAPTKPSAPRDAARLVDQPIDFKQFLLSMPAGGDDDLFTRPTDLPRDTSL